MIIAQITDSHVKAPGALAYGKVDSNALFEACIAAVNALDPLPDIVLHTGDTVDRGQPDEFAHFAELAGRLKPPLYVVAGNHDTREALRALFPDAAWMPRTGTFLCYTVEDWPLRLVVLDSTIPGKPSGELCDERLDWLDAALAAEPDRPTLVVMHHPPLPVGIAQIDNKGLPGQDRLVAILARHPQVERLLCGHAHRSIRRLFGGTMLNVAPATCYQFALDLRPDAPLSFTLEPPAFDLHVWREGAGLVSHTVPIGDFEGPFAFQKDGTRLRLPWEG